MAQVKRCAVCGKFQKSTTIMVKHNDKEVCPVCAAKLNIAQEVITPGKKGVTKHQMIPAIKNNIDNVEVLKKLAKDYPTIFNGSVRYLHKAEKEKISKIFGSTEISQEQANLIKRLNPNRKGITYHQIINAVKEATTNNDKNMITLIKKYYNDLLNKCAKYMKKEYRVFAEV